MERGKYRFELGQIIKGENGEYVITKREKRKDYTKKAIQRKRYTLVCPNKHEFEMEECHIEYRTPKCPLCYHPKIIMADPNFAVMFVNKEYPYKYTCMSHVLWNLDEQLVEIFESIYHVCFCSVRRFNRRFFGQ